MEQKIKSNPQSSNGHYTLHTEAIERAKYVSDVKYDVILATEQNSPSFFA